VKARPCVRRTAIIACAAAAIVSGGCASPAQRIEALANELGFSRRTVQGGDFRHVVLTNARTDTAGALHVYIEGDGTPYVARHTVSSDPTPRHPLMLRLMSLDPSPAVYVGRPCHFGLAREPPCTARDWTLDRFSPRVVDSLERVIAAERHGRSPGTIEIYGHSGGGALAVLLAERLVGVTRIVTLGGNLDTDAWTAYHRYTTLNGSLNPVRDGRPPAVVIQQHYVGDRDRVVPAWMVQNAAARLAAPDAIVVHGATHTRGWDRVWPAILTGQALVSR
jgi:hypothetical protein